MKKFQIKQHFTTTFKRLTKKNYGLNIPEHFVLSLTVLVPINQK